jgi:DNA helicase-2/ATP-dependent DNA helicase PcrA
MIFTPRPKQSEVLSYTGGRMGVSAVPGSGKTWTLSRLAAQIILSGALAEDQEILVVTLVNSAVDNFYRRVSQFVQEEGLLPHLGYRVRTLHALANDILRERPGLVGLEEKFQIVDEREAEQIRREAVRAWLTVHRQELDAYLLRDLEESKRDWLSREEYPDLLEEVSLAVIRSAKDQQLTPELLRARLDELPLPLPLSEAGWAIYADYQRALAYRGGVDFDDLIRLALQALRLDESLLFRLRSRWPYILEDEAQDSSRLQEEILSLLAGSDGNWVRVGDPNQAIYETFTTANPRYLRAFIAAKGVLGRDLPNSGRSTASIIWLANRLVDWSMQAHPIPAARDALHAPPYIEPVEEGQQGANPPDDPTQVYLSTRKFSPQDEIQAVADSLARWLPANPQANVAVLTPRNQRGFEVVDELRRRGLQVVDDLLKSSSATRASAGALNQLLRSLADPGSAGKLAEAFKVWQRTIDADDELRTSLARCHELLRKCPQVEDYLWPGSAGDWLEVLRQGGQDPDVVEILELFRGQMRRWQASVLLPVDQILLTLAQELFSEPAELALAHKLAVELRNASQAHPSWRLPEWSSELAEIARNERRFLGFSESDSGFDPDQHRGKVVVATMHKAKGLEWDRVYLMSVNNYDFPSGEVGDQYIAEKWYLRDQLNLPAETLAQMEALLSRDPDNWYEEGQASRQARLDYIRERLRLLYVGITRARKELVITWNSGRSPKQALRPATPFLALMKLWDEHAQRP